MCVELDLTKPLVPEFVVEEQVLSVVYESMGMLCKRCGMFGHLKEHCEELQRKQREGADGLRDMNVDGVEKETEEKENVEVWKTVQRQRRQGRAASKVESNQRGSRFAVLAEEETGEGSMEVEEDKGSGEQKGRTDVQHQKVGKLVQKTKVQRIEASVSEAVAKGSERAKRSGSNEEKREKEVKELKLKKILQQKSGVRKGDLNPNRTSQLAGNEEVVEIQMDATMKQKSTTGGKDSMDPGDYKISMRGKEDIDP